MSQILCRRHVNEQFVILPHTNDNKLQQEMPWKKYGDILMNETIPNWIISFLKNHIINEGKWSCFIILDCHIIKDK